MKLPTQTKGRACPRSKSGPAKMVQQQRRKASMLPIQEMFELDCVGMRVVE